LTGSLLKNVVFLGKEKRNTIKLSILQIIQSTKFDLFSLFLLSVFTCRSLFSLNLDFVAGTDSLGIQSYMAMWSYLEQKFGSWLFTWTSFQGGGLTTNLPVPIFLVSSVVSVVFSSNDVISLISSSKFFDVSLYI
jgi:hypothetical protein